MRCPVMFPVFALGLLLAAPSGRGVLLDWSTVTWAPGSLVNSYDIDPSNPGNDITIAISGSTSRFVAGYPAITNLQTGGITPAPRSLNLGVDYSAIAQFVKVTITFNYSNGVDLATVPLFDVDAGTGTTKTYRDQIRSIAAWSAGATNIAAALTGSASNQVAGSGLGQTITGLGPAGDTTADGNATISFGAAYVKGLQFSFGNTNNLTNPAQQNISIYNISYRPIVPEVGVTPGAVATSVLAVGLVPWMSRRRRA